MIKITEAQQSQLLNLIQTRLATFSCGVCGAFEWDLADGIWEVRQWHGGALVMGSPIMPCAMVVCKGCGNTLFFNAVAIGFVDAKTGAVCDG